MKIEVRLVEEAGRDRDDIFNYISTENFAAAVANDHRIAAVEAQLRRFPESGRVGRVSGTRELVVTGTPSSQSTA